MPSTNSEQKPKACFYCTHPEIIVDYKDIGNLNRFISSYKKIAPRRRSFLCAKHQREVAGAIKQSRQAGLMPYLAR